MDEPEAKSHDAKAISHEAVAKMSSIFSAKFYILIPFSPEQTKVETEVEFQHGGRLFSETGSSNISAVFMSSKCGVWVDVDPDLVN